MWCRSRSAAAENDGERRQSESYTLSFVEQRGTELVAASLTAADLRSALFDVTQTLAERYALPILVELAAAACAVKVGDDDWRWLIHPQTARVIAEELVPLRDRLTDHVRAKRSGFYVPHARETLVLRQARLVSANEVRALLEAAQVIPSEPMKAPVRALIQPSSASATKPWAEGYDRARNVRDALEWGDDPVPDLRSWLRKNNVGVTSRSLPSSLDLIAMRTDDVQGSVVVNPRAQSHVRREIGEATALGHILFDTIPVVVDGTWEHWPSAARARAFAAMLLMPDEGVRDVLIGRATIDASDVRRVMDRFHTGPYATTYHLKNRGFIANDERRIEILRELVA